MEYLQGWISLHRKLMENAVWGDPNYLKLWIYCLFKASHQDHEQLIGNQMIQLKVGQFVTGRIALSDDLNRGVKPKLRLDELTWWRHLKNLEKWGMLNIKTTNKYSVITIDKYEVYQDIQDKVEQETEQQMNNKRTSNEHHLNTNNNVNNVNKGNKEIPYVEIVEHLNQHSDSNFTNNAKKTRELIKARFNEGFTLEQFKTVIEYCCKEWKGKIFNNGQSGDQYLRPSTLFNNKFDERLQLALKGSQDKPVRRSEPQQESVLAGIWGEEAYE